LGNDPGYCNVTCENYGLTSLNQPGWQAVNGPKNLTSEQLGTFGRLCRRQVNGAYLTGKLNLAGISVCL
jgi:hypothetical protein